MDKLLPEYNKRYLPEQLGYPFPEVRSVWIGPCQAEGEHKVDKLEALAHAHLCAYDSFYGTICLNSVEAARSEELMYHEYAHIIDFHLIDHYWDFCLTQEDAETIGWSDICHGTTWRENLRKLNKEWIGPVYTGSRDGSLRIMA